MAETGLTQTEMEKMPENACLSQSHEVDSCAPENDRSRSKVSTKNQGEKRRRKPSMSPSFSGRRKLQIREDTDTPLYPAGPAAPAGAEHAQTASGTVSSKLPEYTSESQWLPPSEGDMRSQLKQNQMLLSQLSQTVALMNTRLNAMNPRCETISRCPSSDEDSDAESQDDFLAAGDGLLNELESESRSKIDTNTVSQDCTDMFKTEEQFYEDNEPTGPAITERVAKVVNSGWRTKVTEEMSKSVTDRYPRPQNCQNLNVPKINSELWPKLKSSTRSMDIKLQQTQSLIMKSVIPLAQLVDKISAENCEMSAEAKRSCTGLALDTMRLLCFANGNLNQRRRDLLKPDLHEQYRQLCAPSNGVTDFLLGDDLEKQVKTINEVSKVGSKVSGRPLSGRPYIGTSKPRHLYKTSGRMTTNRPFLGRPSNRQMGQFNQFNNMRRKERDPKWKTGKQH